MNQYLDVAIKAARAAGALVRENFGRPLKVNVEEAHDMIRGCVEAEPLGRWLPLLHEWVLDIP